MIETAGINIEVIHEDTSKVYNENILDAIDSASSNTAIMITLPNNPDGSTFDNCNMKFILEAAEKKEITLIGDFTYWDLIQEMDHGSDKKSIVQASIASFLGSKNTIGLLGFSKGQDLRGFRIAAVITSNESEIKASSVKNHSVSLQGPIPSSSIDALSDELELFDSPFNINRRSKYFESVTSNLEKVRSFITSKANRYLLKYEGCANVGILEINGLNEQQYLGLKTEISNSSTLFLFLDIFGSTKHGIRLSLAGNNQKLFNALQVLDTAIDSIVRNQ